MKFVHLSDLHLGKRVNEFSMIEDQRYILKEILTIIKDVKPDGVLIFKWSEFNIPADAVWQAIGCKPLFGHRSGKKSNTFWGCFMKIDDGCGADGRLDRQQ